MRPLLAGAARGRLGARASVAVPALHRRGGVGLGMPAGRVREGTTMASKRLPPPPREGGAGGGVPPPVAGDRTHPSPHPPPSGGGRVFTPVRPAHAPQPPLPHRDP